MNLPLMSNKTGLAGTGVSFGGKSIFPNFDPKASILVRTPRLSISESDSLDELELVPAGSKMAAWIRADADWIDPTSLPYSQILYFQL